LLESVRGGQHLRDASDYDVRQVSREEGEAVLADARAFVEAVGRLFPGEPS
jgi:hypothetical protein